MMITIVDEPKSPTVFGLIPFTEGMDLSELEKAAHPLLKTSIITTDLGSRVVVITLVDAPLPQILELEPEVPDLDKQVYHMTVGGTVESFIDAMTDGVTAEHWR